MRPRRWASRRAGRSKVGGCSKVTRAPQEAQQARAHTVITPKRQGCTCTPRTRGGINSMANPTIWAWGLEALCLEDTDMVPADTEAPTALPSTTFPTQDSCTSSRAPTAWPRRRPRTRPTVLLPPAGNTVARTRRKMSHPSSSPKALHRVHTVLRARSLRRTRAWATPMARGPPPTTTRARSRGTTTNRAAATRPPWVSSDPVRAPRAPTFSSTTSLTT
mmetsp:Transcript_49520/g.149246  ORF Transcript_49520/g.149246 Transcript_49520/m.149246 type:complete len:219 (+) Transcript_49520:467-1123(+)